MRIPRSLLFTASLTLCLLAVFVLTPATEAANTFEHFKIDLTGEQEPQGGDPDGSGFGHVRINVQTGEICYVAVGTHIEPATVAHIHEGNVGVAGPPVLTLEQAGPFTFVGCATDPALAEELVAEPEEYYINIHNADFPDGAVRGQLS
jgi:hypothetical protein